MKVRNYHLVLEISGTDFRHHVLLLSKYSVQFISLILSAWNTISGELMGLYKVLKRKPLPFKKPRSPIPGFPVVAIPASFSQTIPHHKLSLESLHFTAVLGNYVAW